MDAIGMRAGISQFDFSMGCVESEVLSIILETGDFFLTESGDHILLE